MKLLLFVSEFALVTSTIATPLRHQDQWMLQIDSRAYSLRHTSAPCSDDSLLNLPAMLQDSKTEQLVYKTKHDCASKNLIIYRNVLMLTECIW